MRYTPDNVRESVPDFQNWYLPAFDDRDSLKGTSSQIPCL